MKKVIVCGGRDYDDQGALFWVLDRLSEKEGEMFIIHGNARGADRLAGLWASRRGYPCAQVPANWAVIGNAAGPLRNKWMLELKPDLVVAFPGGRGTQNMISQAEEAGVPVQKVSDGK